MIILLVLKSAHFPKGVKNSLHPPFTLNQFSVNSPRKYKIFSKHFSKLIDMVSNEKCHFSNLSGLSSNEKSRSSNVIDLSSKHSDFSSKHIELYSKLIDRSSNGTGVCSNHINFPVIASIEPVMRQFCSVMRQFLPVNTSIFVVMAGKQGKMAKIE